MNKKFTKHLTSPLGYVINRNNAEGNWSAYSSVSPNWFNHEIRECNAPLCHNQGDTMNGNGNN